MQQDTPIHLTQYQLSKRWEVKKRTLERWRSLRCGPPYIRIGARVLYRLQDIVSFEAENFFGTSGKLPDRQGHRLRVGGLS